MGCIHYVTKYLTFIYTTQQGYISFSYNMTSIFSPQVQQKHATSIFSPQVQQKHATSMFSPRVQQKHELQYSVYRYNKNMNFNIQSTGTTKTWTSIFSPQIQQKHQLQYSVHRYNKDMDIL